MSKQVLSYLERLKNSIRKHVGEYTWLLAQEHLKGIKDNTKLEDVAMKTQDAIKTLLKVVGEDVFLKIMFTRGCDCVNSHKNNCLFRNLSRVIDDNTLYSRNDRSLFLACISCTLGDMVNPGCAKAL